MRKFKIAVLILSTALLLPGCTQAGSGRERLNLPANPSSFNTEYDEDQDETLITYNGRTYSYFGRLKDSMPGDSIRECLGYVDDDKDTRIYTLSEDPNDNYLMLRHIGGIMDQPEYLRAKDTKNQNIYTPSYIMSGSYETWGSSGIHYEMQEAKVGVICNADNIKEIGYKTEINGESASSGGASYASGDIIKKGELFSVDITEFDVGNKADTNEPFTVCLTFSVTDSDGVVHEVKGDYIRDLMLGASLNDLEIRFDEADGYYLFEDI